MRCRKVYGKSKIEECPFCGKRAMTENPQGVPVCLDHKDKNIGNLKCVCGGWLDVKKGKFGPYFNCINCGNINFKKGLEINEGIDIEVKEIKEVEPKKESKKISEPEEEKKTKVIFEPEEKVITSEDCDLFY